LGPEKFPAPRALLPDVTILIEERKMVLLLGEAHKSSSPQKDALHFHKYRN
jgi:hypothetical protein